MKILESQSAVLSNAEVLEHLQQIQSRRRAQAGHRGVPTLKSPNFETIVKELTAYLHPAPSGGVGSSSSTQPNPLPDYAVDYDAPAIKLCMELLGPFRLTKAEMLMLLNLRPTSIARLDAIVEEMDMRLSPTQQEDILQIVANTLGVRWEGCRSPDRAGGAELNLGK